MYFTYMGAWDFYAIMIVYNDYIIADKHRVM